MSTPEPDTEQITAWRNLLDSFAQLSAAWQAAEETSPDRPGPMPEPLATSFSRAGAEAADALAGVAAELARQTGNATTFDQVADSQRRARDAWRAAHDSLSDAEDDT